LNGTDDTLALFSEPDGAKVGRLLSGTDVTVALLPGADGGSDDTGSLEETLRVPDVDGVASSTNTSPAVRIKDLLDVSS
jgi:hypothetical protein